MCENIKSHIFPTSDIDFGVCKTKFSLNLCQNERTLAQIFIVKIILSSKYLKIRGRAHTKPYHFLKENFISFSKHYGSSMCPSPVFKILTDYKMCIFCLLVAMHKFPCVIWWILICILTIDRVSNPNFWNVNH